MENMMNTNIYFYSKTQRLACLLENCDLMYCSCTLNNVCAAIFTVIKDDYFRINAI